MKRTFLISLLAIGPLFCLAQQLPKNMSHDTSLYQYPPLMLVKMPSQEVKLKMSAIDQINPDDIKSVTVLKDASATSLYNYEGRFGVIIIELKKDIALKDTGSENKSINHLIINNKPVKSYNLPLYIDSLYVNRPENVYTANLKLRSATISAEKETGIKFINVLTTKKDQPINGTKN